MRHGNREALSLGGLTIVTVAALYLLFYISEQQAAYTGMFLGEPASMVVRNFSNASVQSGTNFTVNLSVVPNHNETFFAIEESIPAGFNLSDAGSGNYSQADRRLRWYHINLTDPNATIPEEQLRKAYALAAPWEPGTYAFSGAFQFEGDPNTSAITGQLTLEVWSACNLSWQCSAWSGNNCGDRTCTCSCGGGVACLGDHAAHQDCPVQNQGSTGGGGGGGGSPVFGKLDILRRLQNQTPEPEPAPEQPGQQLEETAESTPQQKFSVASVVEGFFTAPNETGNETIAKPFKDVAEVKAFFGFLNWMVIGIISILFLGLLMLGHWGRFHSQTGLRIPHKGMDELKEYVEKSVERGLSRGHIVEHLVNVGWSRSVVSEVCHLVEMKGRNGGQAQEVVKGTGHRSADKAMPPKEKI